MIFLVIFPTPLPIIYRLYKPFVLPKLGERNEWKKTMFPIDARLLVYQNKNYIIRTSGWTKVSGMFLLETDLINKRNFSGNVVDVLSPVNIHHSETTLYGVWVVCERTYLLYKWGSNYICNGVYYSVPNGVNNLFIMQNFDNSALLAQETYTHSDKQINIKSLIEHQEMEIENRSKLITQYMIRLKSLVSLTREGTNIFTEVMDIILNILPGNWESTIKRVLLIIALIIIIIPIVFVIGIITMKLVKLFCWFYRPLIIGAVRTVRAIINFSTSSFLNLRDFGKRLRWYKRERRVNNESSTVHYRRLPSEHVELKTKRDRS